MLHSVAHATLSLRCIKVSREKSCNEQGNSSGSKRRDRGFRRGDRGAGRWWLSCGMTLVSLTIFHNKLPR